MLWCRGVIVQQSTEGQCNWRQPGCIQPANRTINGKLLYHDGPLRAGRVLFGCSLTPSAGSSPRPSGTLAVPTPPAPAPALICQARQVPAPGSPGTPWEVLSSTAILYMCRLFTEATLGYHMFQSCLGRDITLLTLENPIQQSRHQMCLLSRLAHLGKSRIKLTYSGRAVSLPRPEARELVGQVTILQARCPALPTIKLLVTRSLRYTQNHDRHQ